MAESAADLRRTLDGWRRSRRFLDYYPSRAFGHALTEWVEALLDDVAPHDPVAALDLLERCITHDAKFFGRADDSDGSIGNAIYRAAEAWVTVAAQSRLDPSDLRRRMVALTDADEYNSRDPILRRANEVLAEPDLRALVALFEARLESAIAAAGRTPPRELDVLIIAGALERLAHALRDPEIFVRATLRYSPDPVPGERERFAKAFLAADQPEAALQWLDASWGYLEASRSALRAEALERLERLDECAPLRRQLFEQVPTALALRAWLAVLPESQRDDARRQAREITMTHRDVRGAVVMFLELEDPESAEATLVARPDRVWGGDYYRLVDAAKVLRKAGRVRGATVIYRALLGGILDGANSTAYGHAAKYWLRLADMAASGVSLAPLGPHAEFAAEIEGRHARKWAFWRRVGEMKASGTWH